VSILLRKTVFNHTLVSSAIKIILNGALLARFLELFSSYCRHYSGKQQRNYSTWPLAWQFLRIILAFNAEEQTVQICAVTPVILRLCDVERLNAE
jgi:hypothetical protein